MLRIVGYDIEFKEQKIGRLFDLPAGLRAEVGEFVDGYGQGYERVKEQAYEKGYADAEQEIARRVHGSGS